MKDDNGNSHQGGLNVPPPPSSASSSRFRSPSPPALPLSSTPNSLVPPRQGNVIRDDSPLLGWSGSPGSFPSIAPPPALGDSGRGSSYRRQWSVDSEVETDAKRVSSDSDLYNFYSEDDHDQFPPRSPMDLTAPALSALSDILTQSSMMPSTRFSEDSDVLPIHPYEPTEFPKYEDEADEVADQDPTMSPGNAVLPQRHPYQSQSQPPVSLRTQQRMNQATQSSSRSPSYYNNLTAYPPSTSPAARSLSQAMDNVRIPSPAPPTAPYSQPIPRPQRERERDPMSAVHRTGSVVSNGSSRSSGAGANPGPSRRRQSGLRSSIVSGDVDDQYQWPTTADEEEMASNHGPSQSSHSLGRPPSTSTRPPSSYQDSAGRGSGYGFTSSSVGGFTSSSLGDFSSPLTADTSVAHSVISSPEGSTRRLNSGRTSGTPNGAGPGLARSPSSGSLISGGRKPGLMRTTSATALNATMRNSSGSNISSLGQRGGLSRSNSYSNRSTRYTVHDSPEPPVPPLPPTARSTMMETGNEEAPIGMATTTDEPVHLSKQVNASRSRASSVSANPINSTHVNSIVVDETGRTSWGGHPPPPTTLHQKPSQQWETLPEDDGEQSIASTDLDEEDHEADRTFHSNQMQGSQYSVGSDEWEQERRHRETDASEVDDSEFDEPRRRAKDEERTAAIVLAEEGGGLIVNLGGASLANAEIKPGTTHIVMPCSTTTQLVPTFLETYLPMVAYTLLALDISANALSVLPRALASCATLEELNIGSNPLRSLPPWLAELHNLQVLIADATSITTLPNELSMLKGLRTLSLRRNKLYSLPSWLCMLNNVEWLLVDENPFLEPWRRLIDPLLNPMPATPSYPPNTPYSDTSSSPPSSAYPKEENLFPYGGDQTITISNSSHLNLGASGGFVPPSAASSIPPAYHVYTPSVNGNSPYGMAETPSPATSGYFPSFRSPGQDDTLRIPVPRRPPTRDALQSPPAFGAPPASAAAAYGPPIPHPTDERSVKKMQSADELRKRNRSGSMGAAMVAGSKSVTQPPPMPSPSQQTMSVYDDSPNHPSPPKFTSVGRSQGGMSPAGSRPALHGSMYESSQPISENETISDSPSDAPQEEDRGSRFGPPPAKSSQFGEDGPREKSKWGFLKKMSMSKMKTAGSPVPHESIRTKSIKVQRPTTPHIVPTPIEVRPPNVSVTTEGGVFANNGSATSGPPTSFKPKADAASNGLMPPTTSRPGKRRSFLPLDTPPVINIPIDDSRLRFSGGLDKMPMNPDPPEVHTPLTASTINSTTICATQSPERQDITIKIDVHGPPAVMSATNEDYAKALRSVMAYLKDMWDLGGNTGPSNGSMPSPSVPGSGNSSPHPDRVRRPTLVGAESNTDSMFSTSFAAAPKQLRTAVSTASLRAGGTASMFTTDSGGSSSGAGHEERKVKDDKGKRTHAIKEIIETERTFVKQVQELIDIYIQPSSLPAGGITNKGETTVPIQERKIVFNGLESLYSFHKQIFLPALEKQAEPLLSRKTLSEVDGETSTKVARDVAEVFVNHAAFMKMYSTYINNFDNSLQRLRQWTVPPPAPGAVSTPGSSTAHVVGLGLSMSAMGIMPPETNGNLTQMSNSQRKRVKTFLKRCRLHPRHSQLNLEGYLLLPIQRIPRYRMMLEQLVSSTPPRPESYDDPIEKALEEIASLAINMNEGKRESESRNKLVKWQSRIRGRFPSPLVQPHRRLIMDGTLQLSRVVRKDFKFHQSVNPDGEAVVIKVECLSPENTPRPLVAILCNDLLVLAKDPSKGRDKVGPVDLWAVLRMQTLPQPASIVSGHTLRLVDHKAIMYFSMASTSEALTWSRAINMHIPSSRN